MRIKSLGARAPNTLPPRIILPFHSSPPSSTYPEESDALLNLAEQSRYYVRQCGGKVVAKAVRSQLVGPPEAEAGGRHHGACATRRHRVSIACLQAFPQRSCEDETPCRGTFPGLGQCFPLCSSEAGFGIHFDLPKNRAQVFNAVDIAHQHKIRLEELIRSEDTVIKRQEVAECWRKMAADFHKEPWFWVSGSRKQVHTFVGTRPWDPLADVVFALTFLAFPNSLEHFLGQVEATICVPRRFSGIFGTGEEVQETLPCPTYMDCLTIMMEADSYESLLVKLAMVKVGTSRIASDFGFQLNVAPGKTEAVVSWVGPGVPADQATSHGPL